MPSVLALVLLERFLSGSRTPSLVIVIISIVTAYLLAGRPSPQWYAEQIQELGLTWAAAQEVDELTSLLVPLEPSSVAFVG